MCTKCGSARQPRGPTYRRDTYGEYLQYTCPDCGYSYKTATADESKSQAARIAWANELRREQRQNSATK